MNDNIAKYLTQQVMTAPPAKLVLMLYDKAILSLKEAIAAIEAGEIETRWKANTRAHEIITHMWSTLDLERGGEIAENLEGLFSYMLDRLPEVDMKNDPAPALEVITLLKPLRNAWREIAQGGKTNAKPGAKPNATAAAQAKTVPQNPDQNFTPTSISA